MGPFWALRQNKGGGAFAHRPFAAGSDQFPGYAARAFMAFKAVMTLGAVSFLRKRRLDTLKHRSSHLFNSSCPGVERQPPCPRATTILAGFQAAEVGVSFNVSG